MMRSSPERNELLLKIKNEKNKAAKKKKRNNNNNNSLCVYVWNGNEVF